MNRTIAIAGASLLLLGAFTLGLSVTRAHDGGATPLAEGPRDAPPRLVDEVRAELVDGYYRRVPPDVLAADSVDGVLSRLDDPYTDYLNPSEYAALQARTAQSYSGVGLTVEPAHGALVVKSAGRGPARAAGIKPGDLIVSVDGQRVRRLPFDRSIDLIQGEEGTTVELIVRRPRKGILSFSVERRNIPVTDVRSRLVEGRSGTVGHIRLLSFRATTAKKVTRRTAKLLERGAEGIVLDLRDNPGGLLAQAVETVSAFVAGGVVCVTDGLHQGRRVYEVTGNAPHTEVPLVVLVDRGSASAAEVVAAALEDHGRAVLVGQATYGKASVQSVRQLSNGAALKLTSAVFRTPNGVNLTAHGLRPAVRARDLPETPRDEAFLKARKVLLELLGA